MDFNSFVLGDRVMKNNLSVLGTGLVCLDIIYYKDNQQVSNGGTCANVLSVLSQIGWESWVLKPKYDDPWDGFIESNLNTLGVNIINYKFVKRECPRVIEELNDENHFFNTVCPMCNKKILNLPRFGIKNFNEINGDFGKIDVFYHDRVSDGIREIVKTMHQQNKLVFYEPNTARNPNLLIKDSLNAEIVKFSLKNVSIKIADEIRTRAIYGNTKVIIITDGENGLLFSYLTSGNRMSSWQKVDAFRSVKIIDAAGAGDWLSAGFIDRLTASWDLSKGYLDENLLVASITNGIEYAKLSCKTIGAQGVFYSAEMMAELKELSNSSNCIAKPLLNIKISNSEDICSKCLMPF